VTPQTAAAINTMTLEELATSQDGARSVQRRVSRRADP